jgi:pyrimidine operon attenuation protein/uracil phosphoribosyltransferase
MPESGSPRTTILNAQSINRVLTRIAHEIAERNDQSQQVVVVGVQRGGIHLADRLGQLLTSIWGHSVQVGRMDVGMHRDDLDQHAAPQIMPTTIPFDINGKTVVLVDVRAAFNSPCWSTADIGSFRSSRIS